MNSVDSSLLKLRARALRAIEGQDFSHLPRRFWVGRDGDMARPRTMQGEDALFEMLKMFGFEHVVFERLSPLEQVAIMANAYAPYSRFKVGVAGLLDDGRIVVGCNVENASYGLGLCAECGMVSSIHASGGGTLVAVACVDQHGQALMPCGRCRQVLLEFGGPGLLIDHTAGPRTLGELLPDAFGPDDLDRITR